jgi:hypothetical protein
MVDFLVANKVFDFLLNRQRDMANKLWKIRKSRPEDWHVTVAWAVGEEKVHEVDRLLCSALNRY